MLYLKFSTHLENSNGYIFEYRAMINVRQNVDQGTWITSSQHCC